MTGIAEYGSNSCRSSGSHLARIHDHLNAMRPRWGYCTAAIVVGLAAFLVTPPNKDLEDIVRLERLAPKIERAPALSSGARAVIDQLISRQSMANGSNSEAHAARRKLAIDRITGAMKTKEGSATVSTFTVGAATSR